ncbi:MAG: inositol monophosphatase family protein [Candidatus Thorarchaeota archaeon]
MDFEHLRVVAEEAARMAGSFLRMMSFSDLKIFRKGLRGEDVFTTFDLESERLITNHILMHFPDHAIYAEESQRDSESNGFTSIGDKIVWFIDPLDGTKAFLRGNFAFVCMSIAAWDRNGLLAGVVYNPFTDMMYSTCRSGDVWLNGSSIPPPGTCSISEARILVDFSARLPFPLKQTLAVADLVGSIGRSYRLGGGISQHLMLVAQGTLHGGVFWGIGRKGKFWDIAAAALILDQLGLRFTNLEGKTLHPTDTVFDQLVVAAPDLHEELLAWVSELKPLSGPKKLH